MMNSKSFALVLFSPLCFVTLYSVMTSSALARNVATVSITSGPLFTDDINGLDYKVGKSSTYTYTVQVESDVKIQGATLGFTLYSPDGSLSNIIWNSVPANVGPWGSTTVWNFGGPRLGAGPDEFDGSLPSSWVSGGLSLAAEGAGYGPIESTDALKFTIKLPGVDGGILCLDSAFFPPAATWLMDPFGGGLFPPEWEGGGGDLGVGGSRTHALCVTTFKIPNIPPCPDTLSISHCETLSYQAFPQDSGQANQTVEYSVTATGSGIVYIDTTGNVTYIPGVLETGGVLVTASATKPDSSSVDCITFVTVTNNAPVMICPPNVAVDRGNSSVSLRPSISDPDPCDSHVFSLVSVTPTPVGLVSVDPSNGSITFEADRADAVGGSDTNYDVTISVTDGIESVECTMAFIVLPTEEFCVTIDQTDKTDPSGGSLQGQQVEVCINYEGGSRMLGGFDFLMSYNGNTLTFVGATEGNIFADYEWEYFAFRFGPNGNCGGGCPSGKLRVIGVAEQNDGSHHPTNNTLIPGDQFACLTFLVSTDRNYGCMFSPVSWEWVDCSDNTLTSVGGDTLYISRDVFDYIGTDVTNITSGLRAELTDADQSFPTATGAPDECDATPWRGSPIRFVDYKNGGVRIVCVDGVDNIGDINLNGISYEIADAVQLREYFVSGLAAFGAHIEASIAASEVNCDRVPLTVADYVYMWRVTTGRDLPCASSVTTNDTVTIAVNGGVASVNRALGGALFIYAGQVTPTRLASNLEMRTGAVDGNTHVFLYSAFNQDERINPGPVLQSEAKLLSVDASDTLGATLSTRFDFVTDVGQNDDNSLPRSFTLHQNYPNPFNPSTTISVDFPRRSEYSVNIYNISGQKVKTFSGTQSAGTLEIFWEPIGLPSGVYLYKFQAGDFVATKKLVLLK